MVTDGPAWLAPLVEEIGVAEGDTTALGAIFNRLESEVGVAEASRRWWAAFAETDASQT